MVFYGVMVLSVINRCTTVTCIIVYVYVSICVYACIYMYVCMYVYVSNYIYVCKFLVLFTPHLAILLT